MNRVVRVELPSSLCVLAGVPREVRVAVAGAVTQRAILNALEADFPMLRGTMRDQATQIRRPFIRFFASEQDLSHLPPDDPLPGEVVDGLEAFLVIGAIAGG